ncbi:protein LAZY 1-like [Rutidosis leptorrhynchoides]|uniref:protein LAZY 1-like n=1 Tax=Rutidosis leptorrhynchoides TaxID=125765 RepID=UPI003A9A008B
MKLLGWMHRKLWHNSNDPFKDVTTGSYCTCLSALLPFDDRSCHTTACFGSKYGSGSPKHPNPDFKNSVSKTDTKWEEEKFELFDGFLAIGTLGSEPIPSEPATPTFPTILEDIAEGHTEVTENDIKLINDELEKLLEAEADEDGLNESSARSSYVSIVTLSGKPMEGPKDEDNKKTVICPLQGYLFGSSVETSETKVEAMKEKASLGELSQRTMLKDDSSEKSTRGQPHISAKHFIKKFLKKFSAYSGSLTPSTNRETASKNKKIRKVAQMFNGKIHPESPKAEKSQHSANMESTISKLCHDTNGEKLLYGDQKTFLHRSMPNGERCHETLKVHNCEHGGYLSRGSRGHWIKTDADYLVLEL